MQQTTLISHRTDESHHHPESSDPWDWMQPHDNAFMGDVISDRAEQVRWSRAIMLGGLPYMWRVTAAELRTMMYDRMDLRSGDKVLIVGESLESCGFIDDIAKRVGSSGSVDSIDITGEARAAYVSGARGRHGQLATWKFDYTSGIADGHYDCVAVLQAVQHADDWHDVGTELLRVMKSGRTLMLGEITFSPRLTTLADLDVHLDYWVKKMFARVGWTPQEFPYYSGADLTAAFAGLLRDQHTYEWRGIELFWGTKP